MWGTQVQSLIQEDSTCRRAIKPVPRKSWSHSLEPGSTATEATCRSWWSPPAPEPLLLCFVWESVVAGLDGGRGEEVGSVPGGSCVCLSHFSHVWLFATLWTVACQAPLSMEILQARILECVAITSSRGSSQPRAWASLSYVSCIGRQALYHSLFFWTGAQAIVKIVLIQGLWYMGHPLQSLVHHPPFESMGSLSADMREL